MNCKKLKKGKKLEAFSFKFSCLVSYELQFLSSKILSCIFNLVAGNFKISFLHKLMLETCNLQLVGCKIVA